MINAADLAKRLLESEKGLTPDRFRKLATHLKSPKHLEQLLAAVPDEGTRRSVRAGLAPHLPRQWRQDG